MKLLASPTSPYARLVRIVILEKGLGERVEIAWVDPWADPPELAAANPLRQIPTLILDDGVGLFDSAAIVDHLDTFAGPALIPRTGPEAIRAARLRAASQGVLDAAVRTVLELRRPAPQQSADWIARWRAMILAACDLFETEAEHLASRADVAAFSVGVACGYLDFRRPEIVWRAGRPKLAALAEGLFSRESFLGTK